MKQEHENDTRTIPASFFCLPVCRSPSLSVCSVDLLLLPLSFFLFPSCRLTQFLLYFHLLFPCLAQERTQREIRRCGAINSMAQRKAAHTYTHMCVYDGCRWKRMESFVAIENSPEILSLLSISFHLPSPSSRCNPCPSHTHTLIHTHV